jgi:hypothetical protein
MAAFSANMLNIFLISRPILSSITLVRRSQCILLFVYFRFVLELTEFDELRRTVLYGQLLRVITSRMKTSVINNQGWI